MSAPCSLVKPERATTTTMQIRLISMEKLLMMSLMVFFNIFSLHTQLSFVHAKAGYVTYKTGVTGKEKMVWFRT